jgi:hypothetical protein
MEKSVERACHGKVLRRVAGLLAPLGFRRAKTTFFIHPQEWVIEFIHLHKYSFAPSYRVHLGIRVLNDVFPAQALNGLDSHAYTCAVSPNGSHYRLEFGPDQASIQECSAEIRRWCSDVGSPWFNKFRDPHALLTGSASPLGENEKARLRLAMVGESDPDAVIPLAAMNEAFPCGWRRVILVGGM